MKGKRTRHLVVTALVATAAGPFAQAQTAADFPRQQIRIVVPYSAATDPRARIFIRPPVAAGLFIVPGRLRPSRLHPCRFPRR